MTAIGVVAKMWRKVARCSYTLRIVGVRLKQDKQQMEPTCLSNGSAFFCLMKNQKKKPFHINVLCFVAMILISSCSTFIEVAKESVIETISDPKTGTQVFTREYDTQPYGINVGGIINARKELKKKKKREIIENYDKEQTDSMLKNNE